MSQVRLLRTLLKQRLAAAADDDEEVFVLFERTIAEYEEEIGRLKEENKRLKVLDAVFWPDVCLYRADTQQLLVNKEDIVPEQQERNLSLDQEDSKPPNVKQEHEKPWTSWEEKQPSLLKEADFTKFHFTAVPVKIENNDENLDSLQFYQSKTDYSAEAEPVACNSTDHRILKMEAGIEDCEELQPARISDPYLHLQIDTDDRSSDSSEPETDDSYEGNQTEEPHSGLNCLTNDDAVYIHNSKFHQIHVEQEYPSGLKRTVPLNSSQCRGCMIERHGDRPERSGSKVRQVNQHLRRSYDANFKLMVINAAESSNNYQAAKKYGVTECNIRRWRTQKDCLKNSNSQRKAYRGPKNGRFQEIDRKVWQYVVDKRNEGLPITRAAIRLKALEIAEELNIPTSEFKASLSWCRRMMRRKGISLRSRSHLGEPMHPDFREKLLSFQCCDWLKEEILLPPGPDEQCESNTCGF
ncbi:uncharacterized protein LOC117500912 [Thalassophryne amazonica]|uniref:uncharacterized protein LOC117500912 n=1 Tax=Thalassophryne amazonica TaxID=390379 RepID=UPI001470ECD1|nr:uncharacterized protein LOC117500912 [Thalassophryne amazonica]